MLSRAAKNPYFRLISFDMLNFLFSIGIFECLFLATLLIFKKNRILADYILATALLLIGINIFFSYLESFNHDHDFAYSWMINISSPLVMLHGPLLFFYCLSLTKPQFHFKPLHVLHLLPYVILITYHYLAFYRHDAAYKVELARSESFASTFIYNFLLVFMIIVIFSYMISCITLIRRHEKRIMNIFSTIDNVDLTWLKMVFFGAILTYMITYTVIISNEFYHFTTFKTSEAIGYCLATILILILGFYGIRQTQIFTSYNYTNSDGVEDVEISSPVNAQTENENVSRIRNVMMDNKPYLDADLTLKKLAELARMPETELSYLLNKEFNKNFFDFVNTYRIEEFKSELPKPENRNLTMLGIAMSCGFNSKATFNRVFKKYTQLTPKAYKEKTVK
jgi:AraC-like DNA-binding protein